MPQPSPLESQYRKALLAARDAGYRINAEGVRRMQRSFLHALTRLAREERSGQLTPERARVLRRQLDAMLAKLRDELTANTASSVGNTVIDVTELHRRATEQLVKQYGRRAVIPHSFENVPARALAAMLARPGAQTFRTLHNRNIARLAPEIDTFLESAVARGVSAGRASKELASLMAGGDPTLLRELDKYGASPSALHRGAGTINFERKGAGPEAAKRLRGLYYDARRIQVSETNNALRAANDAAVDESPLVLATQWQTSGRHHKPDVCSILASQDAFGYGAGFYPAGRFPIAPHSHCGCYAGRAVFRPPSEWGSPKPPARPLQIDPDDPKYTSRWAKQWTENERKRHQSAFARAVRESDGVPDSGRRAAPPPPPPPPPGPVPRPRPAPGPSPAPGPAPGGFDMEGFVRRTNAPTPRPAPPPAPAPAPNVPKPTDILPSGKYRWWDEWEKKGAVAFRGRKLAEHIVKSFGLDIGPIGPGTMGVRKIAEKRMSALGMMTWDGDLFLAPGQMAELQKLADTWDGRPISPDRYASYRPRGPEGKAYTAALPRDQQLQRAKVDEQVAVVETVLHEAIHARSPTRDVGGDRWRAYNTPELVWIEEGIVALKGRREAIRWMSNASYDELPFVFGRAYSQEVASFELLERVAGKELVDAVWEARTARGRMEAMGNALRPVYRQQAQEAITALRSKAKPTPLEREILRNEGEILSRIDTVSGTQLANGFRKAWKGSWDDPMSGRFDFEFANTKKLGAFIRTLPPTP